MMIATQKMEIEIRNQIKSEKRLLRVMRNKNNLRKIKKIKEFKMINNKLNKLLVSHFILMSFPLLTIFG